MYASISVNRRIKNVLLLWMIQDVKFTTTNFFLVFIFTFNLDGSDEPFWLAGQRLSSERWLAGDLFRPARLGTSGNLENSLHPIWQALNRQESGASAEKNERMFSLFFFSSFSTAAGVQLYWLILEQSISMISKKKIIVKKKKRYVI